MKKLFSLAILTTAILVSFQFKAIQASGVQKQEPASVIEKYLNAVLLKDYHTASLYVSDSNEDILEWLNFLNYVSSKAPKKLITIIDLAHSLTRHQNIKTNSISKGSATISVESVVPDMEEILKITHSEEEIKSLFENSNLPLKHKHGIFTMIQENNHWKIKEVEGVSGDSVSKLAMDLAEKLLTEEEALKLKKDIRDQE